MAFSKVVPILHHDSFGESLAKLSSLAASELHISPVPSTVVTSEWSLPSTPSAVLASCNVLEGLKSNNSLEKLMVNDGDAVGAPKLPQLTAMQWNPAKEMEGDILLQTACTTRPSCGSRLPVFQNLAETASTVKFFASNEVTTDCDVDEANLFPSKFEVQDGFIEETFSVLSDLSADESDVEEEDDDEVLDLIESCNSAALDLSAAFIAVDLSEMNCDQEA